MGHICRLGDTATRPPHRAKEIHSTQSREALTDRVAKAWAELAPYGVSPESLKEVISNKVKNAWRP